MQVEEEVWVKLPNAQCTSQRGKGTITSVDLRKNVSVDGMPSHVLDVCMIINVSEDGTNSNGQEDEAGNNMSGTEACFEVSC